MVSLLFVVSVVLLKIVMIRKKSRFAWPYHRAVAFIFTAQGLLVIFIGPPRDDFIPMPQKLGIKRS